MRRPTIGKALVLGRGISGNGAAFALRAAGVKYLQCDESDLDEKRNTDFDTAVISPGVNSRHRIFTYAAEAGAEVISEIELGYRLCSSPVIAVTGTNGKTTTAKLLGRIFSVSGEACVTGNVGRSFAADATDPHALYVAEVSSFQLENVRLFAPHIAVITNITPDHLDRHGSMEAYVAAKLNVARAQTADDFLIVSADDVPAEYLKGFCPGGETIFTSRRAAVNGAYIEGDKFIFRGETVCRRSDIKMSGVHNESNVLSAIAAARLMGVSGRDIRHALHEFEPDDHRMRYVESVNGVAFYDDSKGTNADATIKAMLSMCGTFALIAGGSDKGCGFDGLFECGVLPEKLFVIGETADKIAASAARHGYRGVEKCGDMREAVFRAYRSGAANVLLSPAAASFDRYRSYAERGRDFVRAVKELSGER